MPFKTHGGDDAFPSTTDFDGKPVGGSSGLTKREFFAALALAGAIANDVAPLREAANLAVDAADYLIEALNAQEKSGL